MVKVSKKSETAEGKPELRFGCASHPETKVCPASCKRDAA